VKSYLFVGILLILLTVSVNQVYQDNLKIDFLENSLATKTLHYELLSEITNSLIGNGEETKKQLDTIITHREKQPEL